ncbi:hypothetical protein KR074_000602 [Drosophila pseudoananassae]|nr:hypothetical protein KR074_000602 [Drosophila pseudoananassae]
MSLHCEFNLSRTSAVYYSGEEISGSVTVAIYGKKTYSIEATSVTFFGSSTVYWTEPLAVPEIEHNDSSTSLEWDKMDYTGFKVHINETKRLTNGLELPTGITHLGYFKFFIPQNLPATCRVSLGRVAYTLKLRIDRCGKYSKCFQRHLVIKRLVEFSDLKPDFKEDCRFILTLPRRVFVPGQSISYKVQTKDGVLDSITRLCQCIIYESQSPKVKSKKVTRCLSESGLNTSVLHLPLTVPIMTNDEPTGPIIISYYVETLSYGHRSISLPIYVATAAPPVHSSTEISSLCYTNPVFSSCDVLTPFNTLITNRSFPEIGELALNKHCELIDLLRCTKKKRSNVYLALRCLLKKDWSYCLLFK